MIDSKTWVRLLTDEQLSDFSGAINYERRYRVIQKFRRHCYPDFPKDVLELMEKKMEVPAVKAYRDYCDKIRNDMGLYECMVIVQYMVRGE